MEKQEKKLALEYKSNNNMKKQNICQKKKIIIQLVV